MFNRRTLLSLAAVAALAGGAAGSVTTSVTNPQSASAQVPAPTNGEYKVKSLGKAPPNTLAGIGKLLQTDYFNTLRVESKTDALTQTVARLEAQLNALSGQVQDVQETASGVGRLVSTPSGRTLGNILETIELQTK
jgi:hypothetical protein